MATLLGIWNAALAHLAEKRLSSPTEDHPYRYVLEDRYEPVRDAVFRAHPWNSVRRRASVAREADAPAFGFANSYLLPTDPLCLRVLSLYDVGRDTRFEIEGRTLLTDAASPVKLLYIAQIADPLEYDPLLAEAIAARLAAEVAMRITGKGTFEDRASRRYDKILVEARGADGQEGSPPEQAESDFILARA